MAVLFVLLNTVENISYARDKTNTVKWPKFYNLLYSGVWEPFVDLQESQDASWNFLLFQ